MSNPIIPSEIKTSEGNTARVEALIDSGAFHSLIREDKLPPGTLVTRLRVPKMFGTAETGGTLTAVGTVYLELHIENHDIDLLAFVAPKLSTDLIIGAGEMQKWDISIHNDNGHTTVHIGRDLNDPHTRLVL